METQENTMEIEVSIVMPCLNEAETLSTCIQKAQNTLEVLGIQGEVVVADNGSTDASVAIAERLGARVVHQPLRGYGAAYLAGIAAAEGQYIVMGDSDDTYDFTDLERFITPLRDGCDFVIGNRLKGKILPGAMPKLHRYIGNPVLTGILNVLFRSGVSDAHCGMRSFTREAYQRMKLQTTGMEFASEMVIKAIKTDLKIKEIPITYYPRKGESKLNSFRDGWRHLRFMLMLSPTYLFLIPGILLFLLGLIGTVALLPGPLQIGSRAYDVHVMVLACLLCLLGYQVLLLGLSARTLSVTRGFSSSEPLTQFVYRHFTLEKGLLLGCVIFAIGFLIDSWIAYGWVKSGFGELQKVRPALFALLLMVLGTQTIFSAFFVSMLGIPTEKNTGYENSKGP
ncbi:glycosyltransferase family 2 protein [Candidatus Poribacteria bacterium]|nr:MAG: glycosyltransferase family 2 protein [Candidatus Poribacteria bacterium]